jgi:hypothetical protein
MGFVLNHLARERKAILAAIRATGPRMVEGLDGYMHDIDAINYNSLLRDYVGDPDPQMPFPHAHHILFKWGNGPEQQSLVQHGQNLLRSVRIDPVIGRENLGWAPLRVDGQHDITALQQVVTAIEGRHPYGRDAVASALVDMLAVAARRK